MKKYCLESEWMREIFSILVDNMEKIGLPLKGDEYVR